ncbi:uncharacterized protein C8A04DRAFT_12746 [Dichotomopilus funicola]|uniref:Uncharacterized protein n=1 Tax=Dichotomopilus funicola TaxID=1934379 RepID=A0AAN6V193_9PEZI|nr:hypothetical protein C8A04DRAFT_12746 [Dichotomopilus funicola]
MGLQQLLHGALLFGASAQAFVFLPRPTDPSQPLPPGNGWSPVPTEAPDAGLLRRNIGLPDKYLLAPDNTCGFIDGQLSECQRYGFTASSSTTSKSSSSTESTSETSSDAPTPTAASSTSSAAADATRAGAATSSAPPPVAASGGPPVGGIVGGVIGGIAIIVLCIFGAIFLRKRRQNELASSELPPSQPFMAQPTYPNTQPPPGPSGPSGAYGQAAGAPGMSGYPQSAATPAHQQNMYGTAAAGAGAVASAGAGTFNSRHNYAPSTHTAQSIRFEPSPMGTPTGSPQPQFAQPHFTPQQFQQHQQQALPTFPTPPFYNNSPRPSHDLQRVDTYGTTGNGIDTPDRRSTSTPVSTYNGTTPVAPASALGPMPGEPAHPSSNPGANRPGSSRGPNPNNAGGVPLALQPAGGKPPGAYKPYRPPGAGAQGANGGSISSLAGSINTAAVAMVVPRKAVSVSTTPAPTPPGQAQVRAPMRAMTGAVELP